MKRAALLVLALAAALVVVPSTAAWACSCARLSPEEAISQADLVVRGTPGKPVQRTGGVRYTVVVAETFKGTPAPTVQVDSGTDGNTCGIDVVPGREYVVFADERGGRFIAGLCGGTRPVSDGLPGRVTPAERGTPSSTSSPATTSSGSTPPGASSADGTATTDGATSTLPVVGLGVLVAVGAAVGVALARRRRA